MAIYMISYDLKNQKNYPVLHEAIQNIGNHCHALLSAWVVESNHNAKAIFEYLNGFIDGDDALLICEVTKGNSAGVRLSGAATAWLKANL